VILTLTITASSGTKPGEATRQEFTQEGGTIGRAPKRGLEYGNSWVLSHNKVSACHALISFRDGVFYIEDTSRNGTSVNSPNNRLVGGRPYALQTGDCILIEPYEIDVSIDGGIERPVRPRGEAFGDDDPFAPAPVSPLEGPNRVSPPPGAGSGEVDPLKFFDPLNKLAPHRPSEAVAPPADDWHGAHYDPPAAFPDPNRALSDSAAIPQGYNPLAPDDPFAGTIPQRPPRPAVEPQPPRPKTKPVAAREVPPLPPPPVVPVRPAPKPINPPAPPVARVAVPAAGEEPGSGGLTDVLSGAGLPGFAVTPELAHSLGEILRVVVSGLMDVLQARQRIKEEFRMRQTVFRPADNNPLKFSANVEDALHNLLVKRNAAYLGPVEAFADAFEDLRNHQLAMLAGMRVAFEAMLADFDPDRLQGEFDRQLAKVSLPLVPAKMRYWDLYRERRREMAKDPEAAFAQLFGEEFAQAYEEQFRALKARGRGRPQERPIDTLPPRD
jgi:type VI secretion system FHA domain protein